MLVSICTPAWNVGPWVGEMVSSCLAQTWQDWELCIYDDGSDDSTLAVLTHYAKGDHRIRVETGEHLGCNRAFNRAFSMASGQIIARLDSDDTMDSRRIEEQVDSLCEGEAGDISTCEMIRMGEDGQSRKPKPVGPMDVDRYLAAQDPHPPIAASIVAWAEVYRHVGLWNPAYPWAGEDEWIVRALDFGYKWVHVPQFLYRYRVRPGSMARQGACQGRDTLDWLTRKAKEWAVQPAAKS